MLMRYLETDTLLCWAPEKNLHDPTGKVGLDKEGNSTQSLRDTQIAAATPIIGFLKTHVFPGVDIEPILDEDSIMPKAQPKMTQEVIRGWLSGLSAFDLAAVEREQCRHGASDGWRLKRTAVAHVNDWLNPDTNRPTSDSNDGSDGRGPRLRHPAPEVPHH
ncbi:ATP synthase mitochondrial F1 complex assembly factor 2 [Zalaria obscura]|uniref:ATP synthase mitochondrial F1 complex assembly factor 2 n=1 Tax=Zalaria obscura TaxID=2024903 RepID=A0ACC3SJ99_9PEZI